MPGEAAATIDLKSLPAEVTALIERLQQQAQADAQELARREREIALARVKIDKLNFELARLKRWKFDAKTESMTAAQRLLFADTLAEDEASLQAKLAELQRGLPETPKTPKAPRAKPRRQALPEHLERVEHRHEPEDTTCPNADCGRPMQRIGEDVSEKLDIIPAKFFVHRHIYGKWACKCCQQLRQEPAEPEVVGGGIPAAGLVAHTLISRFVDHLPYYRQAPINARSGVHTPRSTLASWGGAGGESLEPLFERQRCFILSGRVLHADETPLPLLDPGAGKTKKVYVWAWARSHHDPHPGVVYEFCLGRGAQYPLAFLGGKGPPSAEPVWNGTLITDQYAGYNGVLDAKVYPQRKAAACAAHARRRFEELSRGGHSASAVATEAMLRWTRIYRTEAAFAEMGCDERRRARQVLSRPLWEEFEIWLKLQRKQVPDGTKIAEAIDYSLNAWKGLTLHLDDGAVPIDNNLIERQIKPWKLGAKNWLFAGSALAGLTMGRLTPWVVAEAEVTVRRMSHDQKVRLADEIYAQQPTMLASILALPRMGVDMAQLEVVVHILLVTFQAMKLSGHQWPLVTEDIQDGCLQRLTASARFTEGLPQELATKVVEQFHNEHAERFLLAFVYGHLREHDLMAVRTEAEKYLMLGALNLVECVAFVGADKPQR